ncbi:MAG: glutamine-hydrolyzing carbamoyl-phosphate synthase small subunit, partial [Pseudomonadota bacterium]|nr:glutamine-hydrolyzing carbamoyl-phosphate synthase small subunit [Pseudomonadota bacterium]
MSTPAILALADGNLFYGSAIGADGETSGEVVFNTAMTGYQEILTDPSYCRQIVTLTYPHIGNTGVNEEDIESDRIQAAGLIIRDLPLLASNWRSKGALDAYLRSNKIVGIAEIDTRRLTRILRDKGSQNGAVVAGENATAERALELAKAFPGLKGMDLAKEVTCDRVWSWGQTEWSLGEGYGERQEARFKVVAWDYGVKLNILRMLASRGCDITVVPAQTPASEVLAMNPDGVFLSNGPGDPEPCDYAIKAIQKVLETEIPVFGICLGHQLLALASGAKTMKMGHGHHGANHPVQDIAKGTVMITSQNHGFAVDEATLPANVEAT